MFNVGQLYRGNNVASFTGQVIVPRSSFSCNGRMTGCATSLQIAEDIGDFPIVQVWHPINFTFYTRVGTAYGLTEDDINRTTDHYDNVYYLGNVSCTGNDINEFQSGDVIGYYQSDRPRYLL